MDLAAWFARRAIDRIDPVDVFVSTCLCIADIWDSRSDDMVREPRVIASTADHVEMCGVIRSIDQNVHTFWLRTRAVDDLIEWLLFYDVVASSPQKARSAFEAAASPAELSWTHVLCGTAVLDGNELIVETIASVLDSSFDDLV